LSHLLAQNLIRDVKDFPKPGIVFKDITPVLSNPSAFQEVIDKFVEFATEVQPDVIVGIESRGFVFGAPVALALGRPFVPVRKIGKLPHNTIREEYTLEYGANAVEVHADSIAKGQRVLIVDDLLATGGTASASARLVEKLGATVAGFCFLIELGFLSGRAALESYQIESLIQY